LRALRRIVSRIEIDRDAPGATTEPLLMPLNDTGGQLMAIIQSSWRPTRFSNREIVGCEASGSPVTGSRPSSSL
jgi:hypothetical protein